MYGSYVVIYPVMAAMRVGKASTYNVEMNMQNIANHLKNLAQFLSPKHKNSFAVTPNVVRLVVCNPTLANIL